MSIKFTEEMCWKMNNHFRSLPEFDHKNDWNKFLQTVIFLVIFVICDYIYKCDMCISW